MTKLNKAEIDALTARLHLLISTQLRDEDKAVYAKFTSLFYKTKEGKVLKKARTLFPDLPVNSILLKETKAMGYVPLKLSIYQREIRNEIVLLNSEKIGMTQIINLVAKKYKVIIKE